MRSRLPQIALLFAGSVLCAVNAAAGTTLDLACTGTTTVTSRWQSNVSRAFKVHLHVNMDAGKLCIDDECHAVSSSSDKTIEYHCASKDGDQYCRILGMPSSDGSVIFSTAGPFILKDDIVIDRSSWELRRTSVGFEGDRVGYPYSALDMARCTDTSADKIHP
jgi:hypothetical protein